MVAESEDALAVAADAFVVAADDFTGVAAAPTATPREGARTGLPREVYSTVLVGAWQ